MVWSSTPLSSFSIYPAVWYGDTARYLHFNASQLAERSSEARILHDVQMQRVSIETKVMVLFCLLFSSVKEISLLHIW